MKIFELALKDKSDYLKLLNNVTTNLEHPEWMLLLNTYEVKNIFIYDQIYMFACKMDNKLVGASGIFLEYKEIEEIAKFLNLKSTKVAEIGGSVVLPQYRGQNIMLEINKVAVKKAKEIGLEYLIASVHPNNLPSNNSIKSLGMEFKGTMQRKKNLLRNIYLLKL